jgi:hypothetical protein
MPVFIRCPGVPKIQVPMSTEPRAMGVSFQKRKVAAPFCIALPAFPSFLKRDPHDSHEAPIRFWTRMDVNNIVLPLLGHRLKPAFHDIDHH